MYTEVTSLCVHTIQGVLVVVFMLGIHVTSSYNEVITSECIT